MIVILGATGNTGSVAAEKLLAKGQKVRVIGRDARKLDRFVQKGAEAFAADVLDTVALTRAFTGVRAVYTLIPPDLSLEDYRGHAARMSDSIAAAIQKAGVTHAVNLSSIGAHLPQPPGPVAGLRYQEEKLNNVAGLNILHLRPGHFMENLFLQIQPIKMFGFMAGMFPGDLKLEQIATRDVGAVAADALEKLDFTGHSTRELLGPRDFSMNEAAGIIGKSIGRPGLSYVQVPAEQIRQGMSQMGLSASSARLVTDMWDQVNAGVMKGEEGRSARSTTPTSIETFVADAFVPAFQGKSAGA
jgi:uncharacterized protein YbjT (DUF2867 family)